MGFFAIMNPVANAPVFPGLTAGDELQTRRAVARKALVITFLIILFLVGFHMLQGEQSSIHHPSDEDREKSRAAALDVAITPLAMPILAGPGTIATAINFASTGNVGDFAVTITAFLLLCAITYLIISETQPRR
jgi:multiple antibiotic resistance protein